MRWEANRLWRDLTIDRARMLVFGLAFGALLYMSVVGLHPLSLKEKTIPATGDGDVSRQIWYGFTFAATLFAAAYRPKALVSLPAGLVLALLWCWLSATWAIEPGIAVRRLTLTTIIILTLFCCVDQLGYARALAIIRVLLIYVLVLNYASLGLTPTAIHRAQDLGASFGALDPGIVGSWRGVLTHKNYAGAVCAITIIVFLFDAGGYNRAVRLLMIVGAGLFLYKTGSKTSEGILALSCVAGLLLRSYNPTYRALLLPFFGVVGGLAAIFFKLRQEELLAPLAAPDALTGRVMIWPVTLGYARDHPWTGTGFGSFWNIGPDSPSFEYGRGWVAHVATGHNGFFDLVAQIGLPGIVLVLFAVVVSPIVRVIGSTTDERGAAGLTLALLLFCICHNMTETSLFDRDAIVQVFLMTAVALIGKVTAVPARRPRGRRVAAFRRVAPSGMRTP